MSIARKTVILISYYTCKSIYDRYEYVCNPTLTYYQLLGHIKMKKNGKKSVY